MLQICLFYRQDKEKATTYFFDCCENWDTQLSLLKGFCDSAWDSISAFVMTLAHGGGNFYDGWMKNPKSAMISCNDGFRPVSFYLETLEEEAT